MSARRVAITGIGVLTGYGRGVDALWDGLASGTSAVREHEASMGGTHWVSHPMAALPKDQSRWSARFPNAQFVARESSRRRPRSALDRGLRPAGAGRRPPRPTTRSSNDVGLVVTHESPGLAPHVQSFFRWGEMARSWLRSRARFNPPEFLYEQQRESVYRLHSFLYVHYLSAVFGLHGFTLYNNNACASGTFALAVAADRIRNGDAETVIVAGGDIPEDGTKYRWFRDRGLYSPTGCCRPFAARRDGLVFGSGAAAFVLRTWSGRKNPAAASMPNGWAAASAPTAGR